MYSQVSTGDVPERGYVPAEQIRTLLLEDSPFDRERIKRVCRKADLPLAIDEVQDLPELGHALHTRKYDLVLIDYHLPGGDGLDALEDVLRSPFNQNAAKIMISGLDNVDIARRALEIGCHDFLNKDWLNADELGKSVERSLIHARRQQQTDMTLGADVERLKGSLETSLKSTVADVLRSELHSHRQTGNAGQGADVSEMMRYLQEEYVAQERLNGLLGQCETDADPVPGSMASAHRPPPDVQGAQSAWLE